MRLKMRRIKRLKRYLAEFEYRFNRRYDLTSIIPRLARCGQHRCLTAY
jgi:hypothetical protein